MSQSRSVYNLGKILRQLQTGKKSVGSLLHLVLPRPRRRSRYAQSLPLKGLIRRMVHKDVRKRPYAMRMVKRELQEQELQLLPTQQTPTSTRQQRPLSLRTLLQMTRLEGLAAATDT